MHLLVSRGNEVTVVDNLLCGDTANLDDVWENIRFEKVDVRDSERLDEVLGGADGIFHQAAVSSVPESWNDPDMYHDINVGGTRNVFQIASRRRIKVVYASSSSVYGDVQSVPITEDADRNPLSPYGRTKLDCEILAEEYVRRDGTQLIGLRYFNVFGPGEDPRSAHVIPKFLDRLGRGKPPIIFGDGSRAKDFVFVRDVAEANILAMSSGARSGLFNIGAGRPVTLMELSQIMISLSGIDVEPAYDKPRRGDPVVSVADISKVGRILKWNPQTSLEDGLRAMMNVAGSDPPTSQQSFDTKKYVKGETG